MKDEIAKVEEFINSGQSNVDSVLDEFDQWTPLIAAAKNNQWKLAIYLHLRLGANLDLANRFGWTALFYCAMDEAVECGAALKLMGCDLTRKDYKDRNYLKIGGIKTNQKMEVIENSFWECCTAIEQNEAAHLEQALASHECLTHLVDQKGNTLLIRAVSQQRFELAKILIKHGADLFFPNKNDQTALSAVTDNLCVESVTFIQTILRDAINKKHDKLFYHLALRPQTKPYLFTMIGQHILTENTQNENCRLLSTMQRKMEMMQSSYEEKLKACRNEFDEKVRAAKFEAFSKKERNLEMLNMMQRKMTVMQSTYEMKLQDCRNETQQLSRKVAQLEADQLEMARLVVGEPGKRAIQILKASLRNHPINADVSISPANSVRHCATLIQREDKELHEAAKFTRELKRYEAELAELKRARHRNREKLKNQLRSAMSATIIMDDDLIQSIENRENEFSKVSNEIDHLKNLIFSNNQRIRTLSKMEDALCDSHGVVKGFVSKSCAHRVCELCIQRGNVCGRCGEHIQSYIEEAKRH